MKNHKARNKISILAIVALLLICDTISAQTIAEPNSEFSSGSSVTVDTSVKMISASTTINEYTTIADGIFEYMFAGIETVTSGDTLLGTLSFYVNTLALTMAGLLIGYSGFSYIWQTASKGVPGGESIGGGASIIKAALAVSMLAPIIGSGYSPAQLSVIHAAKFGVSVADDLSMAGAKFFDQGGTISPDSQLLGVHDSFRQIVEASACHATIRLSGAGNKLRGIDREHSTFSVSKESSGILLQWGWDDYIDNTFGFMDESEPAACGSLVISLPDELDNIVVSNDELVLNSSDHRARAFFAQVNGQYTAVIEASLAVDKLFSEALRDLEYVTIASHHRMAGELPLQKIEQLYKIAEDKEQQLDFDDISRDLLNIADKYALALKASVSDAALALSEEESSVWLQELEDKGFIATGLFYFQTLKANQLNHELTKNRVVPSEYSMLARSNDASSFNTYLVATYKSEVLSRLNHLTKSLSEWQKNPTLSTQLEFTSLSPHRTSNVDGWGMINEVSAVMVKGLKDGLTGDGNGDLIVRIQKYGSEMTLYSEAAILAMAATSIIPGKSLVTSIAAKLTPAGPLLKWLSVFLVAMLVIGLFAQYILPLMPLLHWVIAVQSWALMLLMAIFFVPLWVMTQASAGQGGWSNEHSKTGVLAFVELVIRPIFLVLGFYVAIVAMRICDIGLSLVATYLISLGSIGGGVMGLAGVVLSSVIILFVAYKLITRTFSLVSELTDHTLQKLGASTPFGEIAESNAMTNVMVGGVVNMKSAAGSMAKGLASGGAGAVASQAPSSPPSPQSDTQSSVKNAGADDFPKSTR